MRMLKSLLAVAGLALPLAIVTAPAQSAETTYTFEDCDEGWKAVENSQAPTPNSKWHRAQPGALSGTAFYNGPPYAGSDSEELLTSPVHKWKGGTVTLSYDVNYNYEPAGTRAVEEGIHSEWSVNGKIWTRVAFHGETNVGYPAFEHQEFEFKAPKGNLQIRFRVISDALVEFTGGAVDNVTLNAAKPASANC